MAFDLGALRFRVIADSSEFNQQMHQVGETLTNVGKDLTMKVTAPIVALGTLITKAGSDFDSAMSKVAAISGATGDDLAALRDKAKEMGETTKFSATESAEALTYMAMAGWKTEDMLGGLEGIMNLAAASGEDLATVSDIVTDAMTAFGLSAEESGRFADVLATASSNANTNVSMMGASFKYVAPLAGTMGYSIEDMAAAIGLMANAGIKGEMAGTQLRTAIANMAAPTDKMALVMNQYGLSLTDSQGKMLSMEQVMQNLREKLGGLSEAEQAAAASTLFGKEAMSGMLAIVNASDDDYNKLTKAIDGAAGSAKKMADVLMDNLGGDMEIIKSQLEGLAIFIAELIMPTLREMAAAVSENIDKVTKWAKENPKIVKTLVKLAAVAAAVGPVLLAIGAAIKVCTTLGTVMASVFSPVALIIAGVIAAIAAFAYAWKENLGDIQGKTMEAVQIITGTFQEYMPQIQELFQQVWAFCKKVWSDIGEPLFATIGDIVVVCAQLFQRVFPTILKIVQAVFDGIKFVWDTILKPVFDFFIALVQKILDKVQEHMPAIEKLFDSCFKLIDLLWNEFVKPALEDFAAIVSWVWEQISPVLDWLWDKFNDVFGWIIDKIQKAIDAIVEFLEKFREAEEEAGQSSTHTSSSGGVFGGTSRSFSGSGTKSSITTGRNSNPEYFASGGILTKATVFGMAGSKPLIGGEAGAEAVIPLAKLPEVMRSMGVQGGMTVNIQSPKALSEAEAARQFKRAQRSLALGVI